MALTLIRDLLRVLRIGPLLVIIFAGVVSQLSNATAQEPAPLPTNVQMFLGNESDCLERTLDLDYCADVFAALKDLEAYWEMHFSQVASGLKSYSAPESLRYYYPTDSAQDIDCQDPGTIWTSCTPAFYDYSQRALVINETLLRQFQKRGDFSAIIVLAHEWGHHIQNLLGRQPTAGLAQEGGYVIQGELQADCYAGMWAGSESRMGGRLEPGDREEALRGSYAGGDPESTGWTSPSAHGQPLQRVLAFRTGFNELAANSCRSWLRYSGEMVLDLADYSLALSPGMSSYPSATGEWTILSGNIRSRVSVLPRIEVLGLLDDLESLKNVILGPAVDVQDIESPVPLPAGISPAFDSGIYAAREIRFEARQSGQVESGIAYVYLPSASNGLSIDVRASGTNRTTDWGALDASLRLLLLGLQSN